MLTNNNLSKLEFKKFCDETGLERVDLRQVFSMNGVKFAFSVTTKGYEPQCRQMYEDCAGFVTLMKEDGRYYIAHVSDPSAFPHSRTTNKGIRAFSVRLEKSDIEEFHW